MHYALIDNGGLVVSTTEWDGVTPWEPPPGTTAVPDETGQASIGWTYENETFVPPPVPPVVFGPTFGYELEEAGLGGLGLTWTSDGTITGRENLTTEQNATLDQVIAAHDPTKTAAALVHSVDWIGRFTNAEYRAATAATWRQTAGNAKNWDVVVFEPTIDFNRKKTTTLRDSLVASGILTAERASVIFS